MQDKKCFSFHHLSRPFRLVWVLKYHFLYLFIRFPSVLLFLSALLRFCVIFDSVYIYNLDLCLKHIAVYNCNTCPL